ncbi:MAG TPA: methyl-accepting chemotaxis protein [Pyrinomonadaceae bacterium]|nr:methyl-accepting chemotaxis protein [Pyrinomonadaceae bacterium]
METPFWNLIIKAASILACVLLLLSVALVLAAHIGYSKDLSPGVITLVFAAGTAVFAIVAANLSNSRQRHEIKDAIELADRLSHGESFDDQGESELFDSLKGISNYLKEKASLARNVAGGDLSQNVALRSDSDQFGDAFQNMIERLRLTIGTHETRDRLQKSVVKLLEEVSEVSAGDLTVQAEVGPEITGEIAEAFNQMTRNLRSLIKQVKDVTMQVASSATAINDTTEQLAGGSVAQASQISRTTSAISSMAQQIQEVSENASRSAEVAAGSLNSARLGTRAARDNINAMRSIRKQVQETAKRIKKLGERAQEIGQITGMIDDLSDRTGLLALNASLQATAAGKSGDGFAVVAEEVERLAERSNRLTQQISALTQTINLETKEVVASMEETVREVIVGSAMADKAGQSLVEIEQISSTLADLLRSISDSAKFQAKSSEDISNAMSSISEVTALVQNGSKRAADSVRTLVELSRDLRNSVAPFKLPVDMHQSMSGADLNRFVN